MLYLVKLAGVISVVHMHTVVKCLCKFCWIWGYTDNDAVCNLMLVSACVWLVSSLPSIFRSVLNYQHSCYFVTDLLHIFSYLPRDLNFIDHTSDFGWKEWALDLCPQLVTIGLTFSEMAYLFNCIDIESFQQFRLYYLQTPKS